MSALNMHGAIDLSSLAAPPQQAHAHGAPAPSGAVVDVTEANFSQVAEQSRTVPVVLSFGSARAGDSMDAVFETLAAEYGGRFLLAKVDVDANPQIAGALQIQAVPSAMAILAGQPVPLFQGAYPEPQVRQVIEQLLELAAQNGVTGTLDVSDNGADEPEPEPEDPAHAAARELVEAGDWEGAKAAYEAILASSPADTEAQAALRFVELFARLGDADLTELVAAADDDPQTQLVAADAEAAMADFGAAFRRLLALVRVGGDARESARLRLVEFFEMAGNDHPDVPGARRELASALY